MPFPGQQNWLALQVVLPQHVWFWVRQKGACVPIPGQQNLFAGQVVGVHVPARAGVATNAPTIPPASKPPRRFNA